MSFMAQVNFKIDSDVKREADVRRKAIRALAGSWKDRRSAKEIVGDIERHRTRGRKVEL